MEPVLVKNAYRMMMSATALEGGIEVAFADGSRDLVRYIAIPEIVTATRFAGLELPNPYEIIIYNVKGSWTRVRWDFVRRYGASRSPIRVEVVIEVATPVTIGWRIRSLRGDARMTQANLAWAAGIGLATLSQIERGGQLPQYGTLLRLARALNCTVAELVT